MPTCSEFLYNVRDPFYCFMSNLWFHIVHLTLYTAIMAVVMYSFLELMSFYDWTTFGMYKMIWDNCAVGGQILKETEWAYSTDQFWVFSLMWYVFVHLHKLHDFFFSLVVDFLSINALVAKSEKQDMLRKLKERIENLEVELSASRRKYRAASHENFELHNTIHKMKNDQVSVMQELFEDTRTAKNDLCGIEQYLQQKSPQHLAEWKAAHSKRV